MQNARYNRKSSNSCSFKLTPCIFNMLLPSTALVVQVKTLQYVVWYIEKIKERAAFFKRFQQRNGSYRLVGLPQVVFP